MTKVKSLIKDETGNFITSSVLADYAKTTNLADYAKTTKLADYLNKVNDKASLTTPDTDETKWVTPNYVKSKVSLGGITPSSIAQNLITQQGLSDILVQPLVDDATFSGKVAGALSTTGTFINGIFDEISGVDG